VDTNQNRQAYGQRPEQCSAVDLVVQALSKKQGEDDPLPGLFHHRRKKWINSGLICHVWYMSIAGCPHGFVSFVD